VPTDLLWLLVKPSDWILYTAVLGIVPRIGSRRS
jgi:hypothetical protein